jgi:hypothetical protein
MAENNGSEPFSECCRHGHLELLWRSHLFGQLRFRDPIRFANLAPECRATFVRWYRAFGILLFLAGVLVAADVIVFSNYHH